MPIVCVHTKASWACKHWYYMNYEYNYMSGLLYVLLSSKERINQSMQNNYRYLQAVPFNQLWLLKG